MANPLDTLKKMKGKSWTELRTRGEQLIAARADQIGWSGKMPTSEEFLELLDFSFFGGEKPSAMDLSGKFYEVAETNFFASFRQEARTIEVFKARFGAKNAAKIIRKAKKIVAGKFDLLGYKNLDFGAEPDWHLEPRSGKRSPRKHWKQFDELDTEETGDKKIVWELNRQQHFFTLGAAFRLSGDEQYAETFAAHLDDWMECNPPGIGVNWASSLEVAFRAISWIWAFNFFKDAAIFTPEKFQNALKFIYLHGRHLEKYLSTYYSPNTHLTGEALGLYYLGTQFPFFKAANNWRETGERILFAELDRQILSDGIYFEQSTWYQRYTTDFYTHFFILQNLNGTADDENRRAVLKEKICSLTDFLMFITRPDGTIPLIGDDDGGRLLPLSDRKSDDFRAVLSTNAVLFERTDYKFVAGDLAEETLWLLGETGADKFDNLAACEPFESSKGFESGGCFVMRDGWAATDNYLFVDCGAVGALAGGHGHADALAVNLAVGGKTVLTDAGTYSYHESVEKRNLFRESEAHNTLTIDGESQSETGSKFGWKTRANARLRQWTSQPRFDFFEGSHDGYERLAAPATHTRGILYLKNDYWIVRDLVETSGEHDYQLNFQLNRAAKPVFKQTENGAAVISEPTSGLQIFTFGDDGEWSIKNGAISELYGKKFNAPHLQFASKGVGAQEFFTFLLPVEAGENAPEVVETVVSGGRSFVINFRGYRDTFVFADGDCIVNAEIFDTNFRFNWSRFGAGESLPEEFVMIGGSHFSLDGREIINQSNALDFAAARRFGGEINVNTAEKIFRVLLGEETS
ncbi:MAG: heparinase II/III family protein [Acidobacteriota bacterium]|nr:heparinase II/III family protein [Acidobacteriota bacterium]